MSEEKNEYIERLRKYNNELIEAEKDNRENEKKIAEKIIQDSETKSQDESGTQEER